MENGGLHPFCALVSRMKYINRWGLMRSSRPENLSEHAAESAVIAHILALTARDVCNQSGVRPEMLAVAALYHDASEILTGDLPTPVKYKNEALRTAYKALEKESAQSLAALVPEKLQSEVGALLSGGALTAEEKVLLKAADALSALVKCIEEENAGNTEFRSAKRQQLAKLAAMDCPAAEIFVREYLPCYEMDLDELARPR